MYRHVSTDLDITNIKFRYTLLNIPEKFYTRPRIEDTTVANVHPEIHEFRLLEDDQGNIEANNRWIPEFQHEFLLREKQEFLSDLNQYNQGVTALNRAMNLYIDVLSDVHATITADHAPSITNAKEIAMKLNILSHLRSKLEMYKIVVLGDKLYNLLLLRMPDDLFDKVGLVIYHQKKLSLFIISAQIYYTSQIHTVNICHSPHNPTMI